MAWRSKPGDRRIPPPSIARQGQQVSLPTQEFAEQESVSGVALSFRGIPAAPNGALGGLECFIPRGLRRRAISWRPCGADSQDILYERIFYSRTRSPSPRFGRSVAS
jgi:hypothetical protein